MGKRHEKRDLAQLLFISSDKTAKEIAAMLDIAEKTISGWRQDDNWDEIRSIRTAQPEMLIKRYLSMQQAMLDQIDEEDRHPTPAEMDILSKIGKNIKNLRTQLDPQTVMEAIDGLLTYLSKIDLALSKLVAPKALEYVQSVINNPNA